MGSRLGLNHRGLRIIAFLLSCMSLLCCQQPTASEETAQESPAELPEDFIAFYRDFHNDSAYQVDHIVFPLAGMARDTAGRDSTIFWSRENWLLHNAVIPDDFWNVDFTMPLNHTVVEFIHTSGGEYWMERRFAKMNGAWYLIYYSDLKENAGREQ